MFVCRICWITSPFPLALWDSVRLHLTAPPAARRAGGAGSSAGWRAAPEAAPGGGRRRPPGCTLGPLPAQITGLFPFPLCSRQGGKVDLQHGKGLRGAWVGHQPAHLAHCRGHACVLAGAAIVVLEECCWEVRCEVRVCGARARVVRWPSPGRSAGCCRREGALRQRQTAS